VLLGTIWGSAMAVCHGSGKTKLPDLGGLLPELTVKECGKTVLRLRIVGFLIFGMPYMKIRKKKTQFCSCYSQPAAPVPVVIPWPWMVNWRRSLGNVPLANCLCWKLHRFASPSASPLCDLVPIYGRGMDGQELCQMKHKNEGESAM
jgi:hypothetical protein